MKNQFYEQPKLPANQIIRDIDPYRTAGADIAADNKRVVIGGRRQHREFLARNGYVEVGNEAPVSGARPALSREERAAEPGEWAVTGAFAFIDADPAKLEGKVPLVLIAPAGSPMYLGMRVGDGDTPEQLPYAQASCVVVAYDVSGAQEGDDPEPASLAAFMAAKGGVEDGKRALDYALKSIPEIDPSRVIAVGHSSAATIAIQLASSDARIKACVAYAPLVDVEAWLAPLMGRLENAAPGFEAFIQESSPAKHMDRPQQQLFLFHAADDDVVPAEPIHRLAKSAPKATLVEVQSGGHYNSMIEHGIPSAIHWLRNQNMLPR